MSDTIKGFRGKDGPILLDYSGVANVPGAIKSIGELSARVGDHFEVAAVDSTGRVATVRAVEKPSGGSGQNLNLTVETITVGEDSGGPVAVTGLSLDLTSYSAKVGGGFYINPIVAPTNASNRSVTWQSSKPAVATVNAMGYVECIAEGEAVITCTTVDGGFTATCAVSVAAAESGGGDSGDGNGGETTGQKIQFSTLEVASGALKADGTTAAIGKAWNVSFPYAEGMFVSTGTNGSWNIANYPPVLVLDNGEYKAPGLTKASETISVNGSIITQYSGTLTGYGDNSVVYATVLASGSTVEDAKGNMDASQICYYIPGGES